MKVDQHNVLIIEEGGLPGDLGDSCAESGRYTVMSCLANYFPYGRRLNMPVFITPKGFIRHPDTPEDWKENDFTSDQGINLLMALHTDWPFQFADVAPKMKWSTAPTKISSPAVMATSRHMLRTLNIINALQGLIFRIPYRWSDSKKKFESTADSSADYLNWIVTAAYLKLNGVNPILNVKQSIVEERIRHYHRNQRNVTEMLALYMAVSKILYKN